MYLIIFCYLLFCSSIGFICISIQAFVISGLVLTFSSVPESFLSVVLPPNNSITASTPLIRARCQISDHGRILFILLIAFMGSHARCHPPPPTSSILLIRSIRRVYSSLDRATPPYWYPRAFTQSSIAQNWLLVVLLVANDDDKGDTDQIIDPKIAPNYI